MSSVETPTRELARKLRDLIESAAVLALTQMVAHLVSVATWRRAILGTMRAGEYKLTGVAWFDARAGHEVWLSLGSDVVHFGQPDGTTLTINGQWFEMFTPDEEPAGATAAALLTCLGCREQYRAGVSHFEC